MVTRPKAKLKTEESATVPVWMSFWPQPHYVTRAIVVLDDSSRHEGAFIDGRAHYDLPPGTVYGWGATLEIHQGEDVIDMRVTLAENMDVDVPVKIDDGGEYIPPGGGTVPAPVGAGVVQVVGRMFTTDAGPWYPFGASLFWAVYGWMHDDRPRVEQHFKFFRDRGIEFLRIFGQVGWEHETIDPREPGYNEALAAVIDVAYDTYGLRTQITLEAGGYDGDHLAYADQIAAIVNARPEKIFALEVANEAPYRNPIPDAATLAAMCERLADKTTTIVTTSCPQHLLHPAEWSESLVQAGAAWCSWHGERGWGDEGWRMVRQSWDVKHVVQATSHNEPGGPQSSVCSYEDPLLLKMSRAVGLMCGAGAYVFHSGSGVYGVAHQGPTGFRPANVWEIPGVDAMLAAIRSAPDGLPLGMPDWRHINDANDPDFPFYHHGESDKFYCAAAEGKFVAMLCGVVDVDLTSKGNMTVRIWDAESGLDHYNGALQKDAIVHMPGYPNQHKAYILSGAWS